MLRKQVQQLNAFFQQQHVTAKLKSRKYAYEFSFDESLFTLSNNVPALAKQIADKTVITHYQQPEAYPQNCLFISHKWHGDEEKKQAFNEFARELATS